jgi:hypothetical protein
LPRGSKARAVYGQEVVYERHRHRFEVNNRYRQTLEAAGMLLSGISPDSRLVEIVELKDHPWFVASQFHRSSRARPSGRTAVRRVRDAAIAVAEGREPVFRAPEPEAEPDAVDAGPGAGEGVGGHLGARCHRINQRHPAHGPAVPPGARRRGSRHLNPRRRPARRQRLALRPAYRTACSSPTNAIGAWLASRSRSGVRPTLPTGALRGSSAC